MHVVESGEHLLREARSRAGITQTELAVRAGCAQSVISAYESGRRQPSVPVLLRLIAATGHELHWQLAPSELPQPVPLSGPLGRRVDRNRRKIKTIAASYGIDQVRVFGSVARGTDMTASDIDVLVRLPPEAGLFALGCLRHDLEDLLRATVDVVPDDALKADVRASVLADAVHL